MLKQLNFNNKLWNTFHLYKYGFVFYFNQKTKHDLDLLLSIFKAFNARFIWINSYQSANSFIKTFNLSGKLFFKNCIIVTFATLSEFFNFPYYLNTHYKYTYSMLYRKVGNNFFTSSNYDSFFLPLLNNIAAFDGFSVNGNLPQTMAVFKQRSQLLLNIFIYSRFLSLLKSSRFSKRQS